MVPGYIYLVETQYQDYSPRDGKVLPWPVFQGGGDKRGEILCYNFLGDAQTFTIALTTMCIQGVAIHVKYHLYFQVAALSNLTCRIQFHYFYRAVPAVEILRRNSCSDNGEWFYGLNKQQIQMNFEFANKLFEKVNRLMNYTRFPEGRPSKKPKNESIILRIHF